MEIKHYSHKDHPLRLKEKVNPNHKTKCRLCSDPVLEAPFYGCDSCEYHLHKSCADLPHYIGHSFHPDHPLILSYRRSIVCDSCNRNFQHALFYTCQRCDFDMDVECALMIEPAPESQQIRILHFCHPHSLLLVDHKKTNNNNNNNNNRVCCFACNSRCSGQAYYVCFRCEFVLHKSCAELPREIQHPIHPEHGPLALYVGKKPLLDCVFSRGRLRHKLRPDRNFALKCTVCAFSMCWPCGKNAKRRVKYYRGHAGHELYFMERNDTDRLCQCSAYGGYCKRPATAGSRELADSGILVCADTECIFKVHLLCGQLPSWVKHEFHIHALVLVDSLIEDDSGEYYCDVCEEERDPRIRVYCCEECKYFAHVNCLISEIANELFSEERRDQAQVKAIGHDFFISEDNNINGVVVAEEAGQSGVSAAILRNLIQNLPMEELSLFRHIYRQGFIMEDSLNSVIRDDDNDDDDDDTDQVLQLCNFTETNVEDFFQYDLEKFYASPRNKMAIKASDLESKTVDVEGYLIPHTLVHVMRSLLREYKDIGLDVVGSMEMKSVCYFILCDLLRTMSSTLVLDITRDNLREWYFQLKFLRQMGFRVDFACARFERLVRLSSASKPRGSSMKSRQSCAIRSRRLRGEIAEAEARLEMSEAYRSSAKSGLARECLRQASELKWTRAFVQDSFSRGDHPQILVSRSWDIYTRVAHSKNFR